MVNQNKIHGLACLIMGFGLMIGNIFHFSSTFMSLFIGSAHYCQCGKWIGHRGFCSTNCHNKYYDELESVKKNGQ